MRRKLENRVWRMVGVTLFGVTLIVAGAYKVGPAVTSSTSVVQVG
jgi:hypothetical protein